MVKIHTYSILIICSFILVQLRFIHGYCLNSTHFNMTFTSETQIEKTWFSSCFGGYHFNLSNNEIGIIRNTSLASLPNVRILDLRYNSISAIEPEAFAKMPLLEYVYLEHNKLVELPKDFFDNKNKLVSVDLSFNKIAYLPSSVSGNSMMSIREVLLHHNRLTAFKPYAFLWNVRILNLRYNNISTIELGAFATMPLLEYLYLDYNELVEIPQDFFDNKNKLVSVDLSFNKIAYLPLTVFNYSMRNIQEVLLHNNRLTAFEPYAYYKQPIRLLDLRSNNISTFTNKNNWTYISRSIYHDEASTDLRNNNISEWHDWYLLQYRESSAKDVGIEAVLVEFLIDIRENPLMCDCRTHNLIKTVRQSLFKWSNSEYLEVTCSDPPYLRGKRAFHDVATEHLVCDITENCPVNCQCQERPEHNILHVDCQGSNLTQIPKTIPKSSYAKIEIHLGYNDIKIIDNVTYLPYITKLYMPENSLTELPGFVMDEIASKEDAFVDFRNNSLTVIPKSTQNIKFKYALFNGNELKCSCDMLWMVDWINLAPRYADKSLTCTSEGRLYRIVDLNEDILKCKNVGSIFLIVVLSLFLVIVIALMVTAKRCPYETKVLLYKIFRIHPSDKYQVDRNEGKSFDMYVSFDDNDPYVRQWVMKVLFRQLENKKPFYKLSVCLRDAPPGTEAEARLQLIDESRRLLIILSKDYEEHKWCEYELCHSETLEQNEGRVIYLLYDTIAEKKAKREPCISKMKGRKVFHLQERMLWAKLRYEMPSKPVHWMQNRR